MAAFLLTWNPKRFANWDDLEEGVTQTSSGKLYRSNWSSGNTKSIVKGDRLFLLKQGVEPKGIMGSGWSVSNSYQDDHWDEAKRALGGKSLYVDLDFDRLLSPTNDPPLSTSTFTTGALSQVYWKPPASGFPISGEAAIELEVAWKAHLEALPDRVEELPTKPRRNPPWQRDELILALDLYLKHGGKDLGIGHSEIIQLSNLLNELPIHSGARIGETFRNPNGVIMKFMNFRRFDPTQTGSGLNRGSKLEEEVWNQFASDPERLHQVAEAIRAGSLLLDQEIPELEEEGCPEGKVLYRLHKMRERSASIIEKAKKRAKAKHGRLFCAVCHFDFAEKYGDLGEDFIEGHHTKPVSELPEGGETKVADIALVCSNCHRMIHRRRPWLKVEELAIIWRA